ncbi:MAG: hypothetical protein ACR2HJ_02460 [Fimbriimonadales bacterium]
MKCFSWQGWQRRKDPRLDEIGRILWEEWDPIGVNDESGAAGQYDTYVQKVYRAYSDGESVEDVAHMLLNLEQEWMGLAGQSIERLRQVATMLDQAMRSKKDP